MVATKLHADERYSGAGARAGQWQAKTGRLWVYVRDDRNSGDMTPPAVWFVYTPDRKGIHPQKHLESFNGTLQADAYGGYGSLLCPFFLDIRKLLSLNWNLAKKRGSKFLQSKILESM